MRYVRINVLTAAHFTIGRWAASFTAATAELVTALTAFSTSNDSADSAVKAWKTKCNNRLISKIKTHNPPFYRATLY